MESAKENEKAVAAETADGSGPMPISLDDKVDINVTQLMLLLVESEEEAMRHVYYDDEAKELGSTADTMLIARRNLMEFLRRRKEGKEEDGEKGDEA